MQHYLTHPLSETYVCGADAIGRRNTRTDTDASLTTCRDCRQWIDVDRWEA